MPRVEASERERLVECGHPALFGWQPLYEREREGGGERGSEREREREGERERERERERKRASECKSERESAHANACIPGCRKL